MLNLYYFIVIFTYGPAITQITMILFLKFNKNEDLHFDLGNFDLISLGIYLVFCVVSPVVLLTYMNNC